MTTAQPLVSRAQARVSRAALRSNIAALRARAAPGTRLAPLVKANAYGHGRELVARTLADEVDFFCVAEPTDALTLSAVVPGQVLCLGPAYGDELTTLLHAGVRVAVSDAAALPRLGPGDKVHLLVDTGLHRLGVAPTAAPSLAQAIRRTGATLEGAFCHVAGADRGDWDTVKQEVRTLRELPLGAVLRHTGGSGILLSHPELVEDLARPGVALFGLYPRADQRKFAQLVMVLSLVAPVLELRNARAGDRVGYAGDVLVRDSVIATLPVGVCHGIHPQWAKAGCPVVIGRQDCHLLTNPMLDYTLIDATDVSGIAVGDLATILGDGRSGGPTAEDIAHRFDISAEHLLVGLKESVQRVLAD